MSSDNKRPPGCENCKKTCTLHLTQIINGQVQKIHMCATCPKSAQMQSNMDFDLIDQLMNLAPEFLTKTTSNKQPQVRQCPVCEYTEKDFTKSGKLGCPSCYEIFIKLENLKEFGTVPPGTSLHRGKTPKNQSRQVLATRIRQLKESLKVCVGKEEYEKAAAIRDQIRKLTNGEQ